MNHAEEIRKFLTLMEANEMDYEPRDDVGPDIEYTAYGKKGTMDKIVAFLKSSKTRKYNRLVMNLLRLEKLEEEAKQLKEGAKEDTKVLIAALFKAEDAVCTRVAETNSFILQISKDPEKSETVAYKKVLEELEQHLTPELKKVLSNLIEAHKTVQAARLPSIKITDKRKLREFVDTSAAEDLKVKFEDILDKTMIWCNSYDDKLEQLRSMIN